MTFRQLAVGDVFRFPKYDDPWNGTPAEGATWKKANQRSYLNVNKLRDRRNIDDPNRTVYNDEKAAIK
jgi:hypothetical protein